MKKVASKPGPGIGSGIMGVALIGLAVFLAFQYWDVIAGGNTNNDGGEEVAIILQTATPSPSSMEVASTPKVIRTVIEVTATPRPDQLTPTEPPSVVYVPPPRPVQGQQEEVSPTSTTEETSTPPPPLAATSTLPPPPPTPTRKSSELIAPPKNTLPPAPTIPTPIPTEENCCWKLKAFKQKGCPADIQWSGGQALLAYSCAMVELPVGNYIALEWVSSPEAGEFLQILGPGGYIYLIPGSQIPQTARACG